MLEDLIQRARRRLILNESLSQMAFAAAVFAGGLALLLVLGTAFLAWWSLIVFAAAGLGVGIYRISRRTPDSYATAVQLDENAQLKDTLSTALHFSAHPAGSPEFLKSQHEQAAAAATTVSLETAVPFTFPRAVYAMAAFCLFASALIGIRYRTGNGLDLRRPITEVLFEDQAAPQAKKPGDAPRSRPGQWADEAQQMLSKLGLAPKPEGPTPGDPDAMDQAIEQALRQPDNKAGKNAPKGGEGDKTAGKDASAGDDAPGGDPIEGDKNGGEPKDQDGKSASKGGDPDDKGVPKKDGDSSKESLMSKLKDAVSSLLAKNKPDQNGPQPKPQGQKSAQNEQHKNEKKGEAGDGKPEKSDADADSDDTDPNGDALGGQKGEGKETTASNTPQKQEGSGIGAQDGSKDMKLAEQLKAMGKISEIIGKRSATVTGETSIEVQSGNQQLHTAYSKTDAAHAETDGDVTRDEIPLAVQAYVQQYFTEVRKAAAAKK
ncbi:MAG TPA: hypothetical protein VG273_11105 [Bryobacteraceae bacterium]|jgi:hypothetical protein|nr:hypothetical protein [Bryobacteraceae bacterium]